MQRNITDWGETFNIEFDMGIDSWQSLGGACKIVIDFQHADLHPGFYYCPNETEATIVFESVTIEKWKSPYKAKKHYPIKELNKKYHIELKQYHQSTKLRRIMKVNEKVLEDYLIDEQPISGDSSIHDIDLHIYNLKVTV